MLGQDQVGALEGVSTITRISDTQFVRFRLIYFPTRLFWAELRHAGEAPPAASPQRNNAGENCVTMPTPRGLFLLTAWIITLGCLAAPVKPPARTQAEDGWTQPSSRREATDPHAINALNAWTPEEIAEATPMEMLLPDNRRSQKLLDTPTNVIDEEWKSEWGGVIQHAVTVSLSDCFLLQHFAFSATQLLSYLLFVFDALTPLPVLSVCLFCLTITLGSR